MGCACTKGEVIGPGKNGLERRRSSNQDNTPVDHNNTNKSNYYDHHQQTTNETNKSEKTKSSSGIRKSLKKIFRESNQQHKLNPPQSAQPEQLQPYQLSNQNEQDENKTPPSLNPNEIKVRVDSKEIDSNGTKSKQKTLPLSIYSFSNLPSRTQNLLNAQHEFDSDYAGFLANSSSNNLNDYECLLKNYSLKYNTLKQVQLYVSISNTLNINETIQHSIHSQLNQYCAQDAFDFNSVCLGCTTRHHSLNKYFKRLLGKLIISDMLNISNSTINNNFTSPGHFIFLIILSDCEFDDTKNNLMCPDEIDIGDLNDHFHLNESEMTLFTKWYSISKYEKTKYKLNLFNSNQTNLNELDTLLDVFKRHLADNEVISLKYLKSLQQEEIDFVCSHIDPSQIVWLNLTNTQNSSNTSSNNNKLNQMRFESSLKQLQSHVLTHNYKETTLNELNSIQNEQFVCASLKQLVEQYIEDLNKKLTNLIALKIDQRLAQELLKHYEIYKYVRVKNEYLNQLKPSRLEINAKFQTQLNEYLKSKTKHPLVINNYRFKPSYVTTDEIIAKFISDSTLSTRKNRFIIYRFCGRTVVSSSLTTLIQSVFHQLCLLFDIHESYAFASTSTLIENISKLFDHYTKRDTRICDEDRQIIIFLDRIDRLIRSKHDQKLLVNLLDKIYSTASTSSTFKLVLTYSAQPDLFSSVIQPIRDLFKSTHHSEQIVHSLHLNSKQLDSNIFISYQDNLDKLKQKMLTFLKENNMSDGVKLIECLIELLFKSRYGLKQTELTELLYQYGKQHSISNLNFLIQICWFTFKYFSQLYKQFNLIETLFENNQLLYRLDKHYFSNHSSSVSGGDSSSFDDLKKLLQNYFKPALESNNNVAKTRAYLELTNTFLVSNHEIYFKSFICNYQWILNKLNACDSNILCIVQDLVSFKRLLQLNGKSVDYTHLERPENEKDEFKLFEHLFYETLYALHQDAYQIYVQFKTYLNIYHKMNKANQHLTQLLSQLDKYFKKPVTNNFYLTTFNYDHLIEHEIRKLDKAEVSFNSLKTDLTYLSKVVFLNANTILALSDTHNEIKIWKIYACSIELVRSIKLNKTPRDLRLLNQKIAVVLVDRNLHLFDLNESKHVLDMNSTMSANVPFFEIHDQNHVVLLARNRLSVILMKVSLPDDSVQSHLTQNNITNTNTSSPTTKTYSADDDMFLFKVGEDRYLNSLLVSKNGQVMVCGDEVQKPFPLLVWNLDKRKLVYDLRQAKHEFITTIQSIGSSGKFVVCACQEEGELKNCLIVYDLLTGQLFKKLKAKFNYVSVEISEEANVLIACLENSHLIVYDLTNGSEKQIINNNRFPVNKIKMLDTKNIFITYDTRGFDWTLRAWDLNKLDKHHNPLISSFTCPTRIISCSINSTQFGTSSTTTNTNDDVLIGIALYGVQQPLILRLTTQVFSSKHSPSIEFNNSSNSDLFNKIEHFNKEINL